MGVVRAAARPDGDTVSVASAFLTWVGAIEASLLSLPAEKDLYFPPEDEQWASEFVPRGEVRVIPGIWGHLAGRGANPKDNDVIGDAIRELLARPV